LSASLDLVADIFKFHGRIAAEMSSEQQTGGNRVLSIRHNRKSDRGQNRLN
jgi:hypothetical protein